MEEKRRSVDASGKTVDEAIAKGLAELGAEQDEVEIEILSQGSRGVLGIGAEEARVRLYLIEPEIEFLPEVPEVVAEEPVAEAPPPQEEPEQEQPEDVARELLQGLLDRMGIEARVSTRWGDDLVEEGEEPPLVLDITGDDLGILIGRRGATLADLQFIVRLMISHRLHRRINLVVDVEQYKVRRRHTLQQLATRMAERVSFGGQPVALEAMPAYERRIIHMSLRDHPDVDTVSVGEGERRKVTIVPKS